MFSKEEMLNYVSQLADGYDPKTGEVLENDSIINRGDIVRLLYALKEFLSKENPSSEPEKESKKKISKTPFKLSTTEGIVGGKVYITSFVKMINQFRDEDTKPLKYTVVIDWLIKEGYLFINDLDKKEPTEKGKELGIEYTLKHSQYGKEYYVAEYNSKAQQFILDNIFNGNII